MTHHHSNSWVLDISGLPVAKAGLATDIYHNPGDLWFEGLYPSALKIIRIPASNVERAEQLNLMFATLSTQVSAKRDAYAHPNVATPPFIVRAVMATAIVPAILMPWYPKNILEHVGARPDVNRTSLVTEIANALAHLHTHGVVHGAVHPSNILVDGSGHVVVTDVGLRMLMSRHLFLPSLVLYQPCEQENPEADDLGQPQASIDVYAFGVTVWAIFAGREPFSPRSHNLQRVAEVCCHGHRRLTKPPNISTELWLVVQRCWADPVDRPTMSEVVAEIYGLT